MKRVLLALTLLFIGMVAGYNLHPSASTKSISAEQIGIDRLELHNAVNNTREYYEVKPVAKNSLLEASAQAKCDDMVEKDYVAHQAPDGTQPGSFLLDEGYNYTGMAENIAIGYLEPLEIVQAWEDSPDHFLNMANPFYEDVGYGICNNGNDMLVVQHLGVL